jgi:hypothetical protein
VTNPALFNYLSVPCPHAACGAAAGEPCSGPTSVLFKGGGLGEGGMHPKRHEIGMHLALGPVLSDRVFVSGREKPYYVKGIDKALNLVELRIRYGKRTYQKRSVADFTTWDLAKKGWVLS